MIRASCQDLTTESEKEQVAHEVTTKPERASTKAAEQFFIFERSAKNLWMRDAYA